MGTNWDDVLIGTSKNDVICGMGGKDQLRGGGGNDLLRGGLGNDTPLGDGGIDLVSGGFGDDHLEGGTGPDVFSGGPGFDRVAYWSHAKTVTVSIGDGANDGAAGEADDVPADIEALSGGKHNDTLIGNEADNDLGGGAGNDRLVGRGGFDKLKGGNGDDSHDANDGLRDTVTCGNGLDSVLHDAFDRVFSCENRLWTARRRPPQFGRTSHGYRLDLKGTVAVLDVKPEHRSATEVQQPRGDDGRDHSVSWLAAGRMGGRLPIARRLHGRVAPRRLALERRTDPRRRQPDRSVRRVVHRRVGDRLEGMKAALVHASAAFRTPASAPRVKCWARRNAPSGRLARP